MIVLAELTPLDPIGGVRETLRCTNANDRRVTGLNDLTWFPAISKAPVIGIRLFKGDFDGNIAPNGGSITIQIDRFLSAFPNARRMVWQGAGVKIWAGDKGQAWPWTQIFEGIVDGDSFTAEGNRVELNLKSDSTPFEKDALTLKYAGTGGIEGGDTLKNQPKPFLLGRCSNVEPVLIDSVNNIYQFSGYGPIQGVTKLYERASEFGATFGDYASYAALVAATIPNGSWATCLTSGLIKLGAPAAGVITGDVDGDAFGGMWRRKTGEIVQRIASNAGVSGGSIDAASWNALDTALSGLSNQGRIGYYLNAQKTVLEVAAELAAPCNAQAGVSLLGKLFACRISIGAGSLTLDAQQRQLPRVASSEESGVSPPFSYIEFGYDRAWRVHSAEEIAYVDPSLPSYQAADPPPGASGGIGHFYVNGTGRKYRFSGTQLLFGGQPLLFNGEPIYTSGYVDAQDQLSVSAFQNARDAIAITDLLKQQLADIDDDGVIDPSEKIDTLIPALAAFEASYVAIAANATAAGVSITALNTKRAAWLAFIAALVPPVTDTSQSTLVSRGGLDTVRDEYDDELKSVQAQSIESMTPAKQISIVPPVAQKVYRDWQGSIKSGQYPRTLTPKVERGGVDIRDDNDVGYSISLTGSIAATVNNSTGDADKGRITVTDGSSGSILLTITVAGITQPVFTISFTNQDDNPPSGGGGNAGGSDSTLENVTSTSFAAITQQDGGESVFLIDITSGETLYGTAPLNYQKSGTNSTPTAMVARWEYRLQGDPTWLPFVAGPTNITGTGAYWLVADLDAIPGEINANQSKGGLATGTYEVQLVAAKSNSAAGDLQVLSGAAVVSKS